MVFGWLGAELVSYGWLASRRCRVARLNSRPLARGHAVIHRCFTRADFLGRRIYPAALSLSFCRLADHRFQRVFIFHEERNLPSKKAIVASGMQLIDTVVVRRVLGWKWASFSEALCAAVSGGKQ